MSSEQPIVVCGAGLAGIATAHHLSTILGLTDVVLVDPRPPLTLTSDKSTECYRNWWPNRPMVEIMNRSIDLLEDFHELSGRTLGLNRRGYLYVTADPSHLARMETDSNRSTDAGAGDLRRHTTTGSYQPSTPDGVPAIDGADLLTDQALYDSFPYLSHDAVGGLHARRAGWLSAQQLGSWMLQRSIDGGTRLVKGEITGIRVVADRVDSVVLDDGSSIPCQTVVNASGPMLAVIAGMVDVSLPVVSEVHTKMAFRDRIAAIPRQAPMLIWCDPQTIDWTTAESAALTEMGRDDLTGTMRGFCHGRPEGRGESSWVLALWEYRHTVIDPVWPIPTDDLYAEVVIRGMTTMIPALKAYWDRLPEPVIDGGYYTRTRDNIPLVGPIGPDGFILAGAMGGFGVMASAAVGEIAAHNAAGIEPAPLADHVSPTRFDDPNYQPDTTLDGQL